jgi:hypothetical protein
MQEPQKINRVFLTVGSIGTILCVVFWHYTRSISSLIGLGLFGYFLISGLIVLLHNRLRH